MPPRVLPVGDRAAAVELGDAIDPALNARVRALADALPGSPLPGLIETVPTYRSLLVLYEPAATGFTALATGLLERAAEARAAPQTGLLHEIATCYGGEEGPDLPEVARRCGLPESEVVALHGSTEYTVFMLGFRPGFPYLGLLPAALALPRPAAPPGPVPPRAGGPAGR